ncbi:hypothetical protein COLO4_04889 [Corchorus olitorius]|uniref:Uncharacterized protein n=1 Tax=Corchorus olitorius TaxID=93759 RepID=A0A1R3KSJ0_9ROSI|nr:hypothetical protein COLO4_04889 [Corchorus olitorius]
MRDCGCCVKGEGRICVGRFPIFERRSIWGAGNKANQHSG